MAAAADSNSSSSALSQWFIVSVNKLYPEASDSVCSWLEDLRMMTDTECMCVLQGKSLVRDSASDIHMVTAKTTKDCIDVIKGRAHIISSEFTKLYRRIEKERWNHVHPASMKLTCQIRTLLHECNNNLLQNNTTLDKHQQLVMEGCAKLAQYVESSTSGHEVCEGSSVMALLTQLGAAFSSFVDCALGSLVQSILCVLEDGGVVNEYTVRSILTQIVSLGLEGEHFCYIITREGGLRLLFSICMSPHLAYAHPQCLRAIATLCCVPEAIQQIEQLVTVLANMSGVESCCEDLVECRVPDLLVTSLLQQRIPKQPHQRHAPAEVTAMEHILQKSAIAITRLARSPHTAQTMVQLKVIPRLMDLCKKPTERNHSDAVLMACLAALRKVCSMSEYKHYKAHDDLHQHEPDYNEDDLLQLIQPKLMESFAMCAGLDESIV